jgi:Carboxypeptidase regulatory-like domain
MRKRLLVSVVLTTAFPLLIPAQTGDASTPRKPEVFLDNHRPLNPKKQKDPTTRNVSGKVTDAFGQPLDGALVTLTNGNTNEKRTFITKKDGHYNFDDLSFTIDYQLQARYKAQTTDIRKLSQYDRNVNVVRILQMNSEDSGAAKPAEEARKQTPSPNK